MMSDDGLDGILPPVNLSRIADELTKDVVLQKKLYQVYLGDMGNRLVELDHALESMDYPALRRVAHSIKGTSANIGAVGMQALAFQVEKAAEARDSDKVPPKAEELKEEYAIVRDFLLKFIASD